MWVLEHVIPETLPEAKVKLSYTGHIVRRQRSLQKTIVLGKIEGIRERGRPNTRWSDSVKQATGMMRLQELSRAVEDRTLDLTHSQCHQKWELTQQQVIHRKVFTVI